ncbi:MAG: glycosyltransferase family 1 protein [Cytophagia bacterium]|nr:glycosyltransferase family 1 protein [Cytophagia bacterium]NBW34963.1 glycosyltransferase family 1 protein [Cytophagia bacterium]
MNLLIDAHVLDGTPQGTSTYIKGLYHELIKQMPSASFYFVAVNVENLKQEIGQAPNVYFIQLKQKKFLRLLIEIPWIIYKYKIDYAHFQYISPPLKLCKYIVTTHDILFKDFKHLFPLKYRIINDFLFKFSARRADILLTVSQYSRESIAIKYRIPINKIAITHNGVSNDFFVPIEHSDIIKFKSKYKLDRYILYISRIEPRKNHILLLKAFNDLRLWNQNYKLVFIGKRDFSHHELDLFLEGCVEDCRNSTLYFDNIEQNELVKFYKGAELFVYPSLAEGFGIPPIEAIAAGTPILCSNATAMSDFEFLKDDLFDPYNLEELKMKMLNKLNQERDPNQAGRLQQIVSQRYSWHGSAEKFIFALNLK